MNVIPEAIPASGMSYVYKRKFNSTPEATFLLSMSCSYICTGLGLGVAK